MTAWAVREAEAQLVLGEEVPTGRLQRLVEADGARPCVARDPEEWFPVHETPELAESLCSGCGVRELCLELALRQPQDGVWGGTTTKDRERQLRRRRRSAGSEAAASDGTAA